MSNLDQEQAKSIVIDGYTNILKRMPDKSGMDTYSKLLISGELTPEQFCRILIDSEEYKNRFGSETVQNLNLEQYKSITTELTTLGNNAIVYCMMGGNKLHEIKDYIYTTLKYIDKFVYIDGYSTDGTVEFLNKLSKENGNKIILISKEWVDKFSYFRNFYLEYLRSQNYNGWVIVSDTDEHYPIDTLSRLRDIIKISNNGTIFNGIQFRAYDIIVDDNNPTKVISESLSTYWKALMFKFYPNIHYEGEPHETLCGAPINWKKTDLIYKHIRSQRKIYERAVENFFISNSNRCSQKWSEFRSLCTDNKISRFKEFFSTYKNGTLSKEIENWIYNHRNDSKDGDSEVREMAKLYFEILHPTKLSRQ